MSVSSEPIEIEKREVKRKRDTWGWGGKKTEKQKKKDRYLR